MSKLTYAIIAIAFGFLFTFNSADACDKSKAAKKSCSTESKVENTQEKTTTLTLVKAEEVEEVEEENEEEGKEEEE